jgi:hypothetical protein
VNTCWLEKRHGKMSLKYLFAPESKEAKTTDLMSKRYSNQLERNSIPSQR